MSGYRALRESAAWLNLSDRGRIRVQGEDRARLLHALSTNDVLGLRPDHSQEAFFLNEKGRVVAHIFIYSVRQELWLDTEPELRPKLPEHLERYIIADDVELTDESDALACFAVEGPTALALAAKLGVPSFADETSVVALADGFAVCVSSTGQPGVRIFTAASEQWLKRFEEITLPQASIEEARIVRLERGLPRYGEDISDKYLVQETQMLHAVHPAKGCYLGQEIVERVRSQGQVHRLLTSLRINRTSPPAPGTKLLSNSAEVGEITSAAFSPAQKEIVALGYIRRQALESRSPITLAGDPGSVLIVAQQLA